MGCAKESLRADTGQTTRQRCGVTRSGFARRPGPVRARRSHTCALVHTGVHDTLVNQLARLLPLPAGMSKPHGWKKVMVNGLAVWATLVIAGVTGTRAAGHNTSRPAEALRIRVSPAICNEPGIVQVMVRIPGNPDNRTLSVAIDGADYYSNSGMQLDGEDEPATRVFPYRSLPSGEYTVTVTLRNRQGGATVAEGRFRVLSRTGT